MQLRSSIIDIDPPSRHAKWIGWSISGVVAAALMIDAGGKLIAPQLMIDTTPPALQLPRDVGWYRTIGGILAVGVALHFWRPTAFLGAVLITGFLGDAIAANARAAMPLGTNTLVGVYMGGLLWLGFWLRDPRLRALLF